jgi:isocitrate/isopropylmalate dehydrogenase
MLAAAMMLDHLGEAEAAARLRRAITVTIRDAAIRTRDLGGTASTREFGDAIVARLG